MSLEREKSPKAETCGIPLFVFRGTREEAAK